MGFRKSFALAEALFVPVFVLTYLWWLKDMFPYAYVVAILLVLISLLVQNDLRWNYGRYMSGLSGVYFWSSMRRFFLPILGICLAVLAIRWKLGHIISGEDREYLGHNFIRYIPLALCQQVLLNSYLVRRLEIVFEEKNSHWAAFLIAVIFYAVHYPNPVLMGAGFIGGYIGTQLFFRYRDIYSLSIFHAMIGGTIHIAGYLTVVGPAYWKFAKL